MSNTSQEPEDEILLTDINSKSNRKINYIKSIVSSDIICVKTSNNSSWNFTQKLKSIVKDIFLPKGYPSSVSEDYLEYQLWDTCQAFCSSISGTLTVSAIMQGIGVGSETATPVSAAVTWLMKDGTGMIGSILFAWLKGSKLDSDCKKWRLFADILNDIAMLIELYIPFVLNYSMYMLCIATAFKALVGTAGGSTRAALITHQAIKGNIADVSAKDGSQEIFTNLCAFVFGIFLLKNVTEVKQMWRVMCTTTLFHLLFNYKAVKCLKMSVFNAERFRLCLRVYLSTSVVPSIHQVNKRESVFLFRGLSDFQLCDFSVVFGHSIKKVVQTNEITASQFSNIELHFQSKNYFVLPHLKRKKLYVCFRPNFCDNDVLKAYFHAFLLGISFSILFGHNHLDVIRRCRKNSPIYRLKNILQEFVNHSRESSGREYQEAIIAKAYTACEDLINKEFAAFSKNCIDQRWSMHKHLIIIEEWRAEWKYLQERKEEKTETEPSRIPRSPKPKDTKIRPSKGTNMSMLVIT